MRADLNKTSTMRPLGLGRAFQQELLALIARVDLLADLTGREPDMLSRYLHRNGTLGHSAAHQGEFPALVRRAPGARTEAALPYCQVDEPAAAPYQWSAGGLS